VDAIEPYMYVIFLMVIVILYWMTIGLHIALSVVCPKTKSLEITEKEENERDNSLLDFYHMHLTDQRYIKSKFGYSLAIYDMIHHQTNKFVVMSHGYTYSHHGLIKYAKMMISLGFNVVLYDQRYHGQSGGKNTSLGYFEQDDLKTVIDHVYQRFGPDIVLGTYGESMGAATCLLEQAHDPRVKFIISDASFARLKPIIKKEIRQKKLPAWIFFQIANAFVYLISKANLIKVQPIEALEKAKIPILFVHGKQDDFIPYQDTETMYRSYDGPKEIFLADKEAYHARSYYFNKTLYYQTLKSFIETYVDQ